MLRRSAAVWGLAFFLTVVSTTASRGQTPPAASGQPAAAEPLPVPKGVEVLARGPVHEAFATPTTEPVPTKPVAKQPPKALEEMPPDEKPAGDVVWIAGYWAFDDERKDYIWVSGIWRKVPPSKRWVAGYWRPEGEQWQYVPGFWTATQEASASSEVTYLPAPPGTPETAKPGEPPTADSFYVPGTWVWTGDHYAWKAGYWARVQPGYVWVASHYRWTPAGYIFVAGYWDLAIGSRGVLYAPVYVDSVVIGPHFVYTPAYVVPDTVVVDAMFVRPCCCHYYFGDYYGPVYRDMGYESCVVYSRGHYDSIFVYSSWEHRYDPRWSTVQLDITMARYSGVAPRPPRTVVQNNVTVNNITVNNTVNNYSVANNTVVPARQYAAARNMSMVPVSNAARVQAQQQAQTVQQVAVQRSQAEVPISPGASIQPRRATLPTPSVQPVGPARPTGPGAFTPSSQPSYSPAHPTTTTGPSYTVPPSMRPGATPPATMRPATMSPSPMTRPAPPRRPAPPQQQSPQSNRPSGN